MLNAPIVATAEGLPEVSRRGFLGHVCGAYVATSLVPDVAAVAKPNGISDLDADLLRLGLDFERAWASEVEAEAVNQSSDYVEDAMEITSAIVNQILILPATTLAGLRVKSRAVFWCRNGEPITDETIQQELSAEERCRLSIVRDLLAINETTA